MTGDLFKKHFGRLWQSTGVLFHILARSGIFNMTTNAWLCVKHERAGRPICVNFHGVERCSSPPSCPPQHVQRTMVVARHAMQFHDPLLASTVLFLHAAPHLITTGTCFPRWRKDNVGQSFLGLVGQPFAISLKRYHLSLHPFVCGWSGTLPFPVTL